MERHLREMDRFPTDPVVDEVEYLDDRLRPIPARAGPSGRRLSLPGGLGVAFLATTIALGAAMVDGGSPPSGSPADRLGGAAARSADPGQLAHAGDGDRSSADRPEKPGGASPGHEPNGRKEEKRPTERPGGGATDGSGPDEEPARTAAPVPAPTQLALTLGRDGASVVVDWSACDVDGFYAYRVVRSSDPKVSWPVGDGDTLRAVIEDAARTSFVDEDVDVGRTYHYRVMAFAELDGIGYTACKTFTKAISLEAPMPTQEPTSQRAGDGLELAVTIREGAVHLDWSECRVTGFDAYKVVRSKDSTVAFPEGAADRLVTAVGPDGRTAIRDEGVPAGKTIWYRVFCVDKVDGAYRVVAASPTRSITTPAVEATPRPTPRPTPQPTALALEVATTGDGVALAWQSCCAHDGFVYYKVVRSRGENPSYLPGTDGSVLIAVLEDPAATTFLDTTADAGAWFYRVQAIGKWDGHKVLLGETPVRSIVFE